MGSDQYGAWLELKKFEKSRSVKNRVDSMELRRFLDFVKKVALDFDGSSLRTMLRTDGFWFMRLGHYIEKADNTARILDVKYHVLLPESEPSAARSTISSGPRSCARCRRSRLITGSIARA